MIYIASPYSHPLDAIRQSRYKKACEFVDLMVQQGYVAFSPIVYCHPIAERTQCGTDAETWINFNMSILRRAEGLFLLKLNGWDESKGVKIELNVCKMLGIPITEFDENFRVTE